MALAVPTALALAAPAALAAPVTVGPAPAPPAQAAPAKRPRAAIANGERIPVTATPYQVFVRTQLSQPDASGRISYGLCGGSIVSPTLIVTAAHCTFNDKAGNAAIPPGAFQVYAGVSQYDPNTLAGVAGAGDQLQQRGVSRVRVHPQYQNTPQISAIGSFADDVATLTLATPLDVNRPTAQAIALPAGGPGPSDGATGVVSGYGLQVGRAPGANGGLYRLGETIADSSPAGATGPYNAIMTLGRSAVGSFCQGDSGGPLNIGGTLAGIVSTNASLCAPNEANTYTAVAAPEILAFIQGNDAPPLAPRGGQDVRLAAPRSPLTVGDTVTCTPGAWSNAPSFAYEFRDGATGAGLQGGPSNAYTLTAADAGRTISCRGIASNAGGVGRTPPTPPIGPAVAAPVPRVARLSLSVRRGATSVRRRRTVPFRVTVRNSGVVAATSVRICVRPSTRLGFGSRGGGRVSRGRLCFSTSRLQPKRSATRRFSLRAKSNAKTGRTSVTVTASASRTTSQSKRTTVKVRRR